MKLYKLLEARRQYKRWFQDVFIGLKFNQIILDDIESKIKDLEKN